MLYHSIIFLDQNTLYHKAEIRQLTKYGVPLKNKFISSCVVARGARKCFLNIPQRSSTRISGDVIISATKMVMTAGSKLLSPSDKVFKKGVMIVIKTAVTVHLKSYLYFKRKSMSVEKLDTSKVFTSTMLRNPCYLP